MSVTYLVRVRMRVRVRVKLIGLGLGLGARVYRARVWVLGWVLGVGAVGVGVGVSRKMEAATYVSKSVSSYRSRRCLCPRKGSAPKAWAYCSPSEPSPMRWWM